MGLETGDYISDLVSTNPTGVDQKLQGDDHLRLIKHVLKTTFPNVDAAVDSTPEQLNAFAAIFPLTDDYFIRAVGTDALELRSPAQVRSDIGADNAANLTSGDLADARLSANVPLLNAANVFTLSQTIDAATTAALTLNGTAVRVAFEEDGQAADEIKWRIDVNTKVFTIETNSDDSATQRTILSATRGTGIALTRIVLGNPTDDPEVEVHCSDFLFTPSDGVEYQVGYRNMPVNTQNGSYGLVLADAGKIIYKASGGAGETITIPASSTAFPVGTVITIANRGGGTLTIAITTDTLELAGTASVGSRVLADKGIATIVKVATTVWMISGSGLT
jgi:hypothetical protein